MAEQSKIEWTPQQVTDLEMAFGVDISRLMPPMRDIPDDYKRSYNPYCRAVNQWFFRGLQKSALRVKDGIDQEQAFRHLTTIMRSFEPAHEHKEAAVAYLMSQWFELVSEGPA